MKHPFVIFVGDRPSRKNKSVVVPFVGTPSYKRLLEWIYEMDLDFRACDIVNASDNFLASVEAVDKLNAAISCGQVRVVALGEIAKRYLAGRGVVSYLNLPHPSPRNRVLNSKVRVKRLLKEVKGYIYTA